MWVMSRVPSVASKEEQCLSSICSPLCRSHFTYWSCIIDKHRAIVCTPLGSASLTHCICRHSEWVLLSTSSSHSVFFENNYAKKCKSFDTEITAFTDYTKQLLSRMQHPLFVVCVCSSQRLEFNFPLVC